MIDSIFEKKMNDLFVYNVKRKKKREFLTLDDARRISLFDHAQNRFSGKLACVCVFWLDLLWMM